MTERDDDEPGAGDGSIVTPEMIERFRQVGLRLDRAGRLWHQEREITHPRLRRAILRWLDRRENDGRPIVRMDEQRYAYIEVEDAELIVTSARWDGNRAVIAVNDGSEEELAYASLEVGPDDALYCAVRNGKLRARIATSAYYVLAERIDEREDGGFDLCAAGERFPIRRRT